ncbi:predicted protein [Nematostella vectensis]|uniref:F5/8 type C domain-containing protein n=1 Tax=Nematostella vectensis TaxID=45351 RepID=A7RV35_NEMVE|nr:predicted protein [Nematostella vectensis]|eukprot:XP_001636743.1 predicted protein [Nematostella vectensis]
MPAQMPEPLRTASETIFNLWSTYTYHTLVKHSPQISADAKGVHVTWMLAPFLSFQDVTSYKWQRPRVEKEEGHSTFVIPTLQWMQEIEFTFSVMFDHDRKLKPGRHHVITPVHMHYYKDYTEDARGLVLSKGQYFSQPLATVEFVLEVPVKCISPLGMESGQIPDEALTTSVPNDYQGGVSKAANGRLNKVVTSYPNGWAARMQASNDYLQIDFGSLRKVTRVAIQGAYSGSRDVRFFTKAYTLSSSRTGLAWTGYTEDGTLKNIKGPSDSGAAKWPLLYKLKKPIVARYLRIHPTEMMIIPVLRAEVYGCLSEPLPLYTGNPYIMPQEPKIEFQLSYQNVNASMTSGSTYTYHTLVKHSPQISADAKGVHVTWMLAPFLSFQDVTSYKWQRPRVEKEEGHSTFVIPTLKWMQEIEFTFSVMFDHDRKLKPGRHQGSGCSTPLGREIADYQITASSSYLDAQPTQARQSDDAWCAFVTNDQQYIQVDFPRKTRITQFVTYGRRTKLMWVTQYSLQYSDDETNWKDYTENGHIKELSGAKDASEAKYAVMVKLAQPFLSRYMRIIPTKANTLKIMRAEVYGCMAEPTSPYEDLRAVACQPLMERNGMLDEYIIGVIAAHPDEHEVFGIDASMNFFVSRDRGASWSVISSKHFRSVQKATALIMASGVPDNLVSDTPSSMSAVSSKGTKWGVSGLGIHMMTAGSSTWDIVGSWRCCGV